MSISLSISIPFSANDALTLYHLFLPSPVLRYSNTAMHIHDSLKFCVSCRVVSFRPANRYAAAPPRLVG